MNVTCLDNNTTNGGCLTVGIFEIGFVGISNLLTVLYKTVHIISEALWLLGELTFKKKKDQYICYA